MIVKLWAGAALLLLTCGAFALGSNGSRADDQLSLKVLTFNIRYDNSGDGPNRWSERRDAVVDLIRRSRADFVGVQEALPNQVADLQKMLPEYRLFGRSREADAGRGESGPILYRHKRWRLDPAQSGWFWLSDTPQTPGSITWGNACSRMVVWGRFLDETSGRGVYFFNAHFDHVSEPSRLKSAELLAHRINGREQRREPVVVTGDFNADESSPALRYLTGGNPNSPVKLVDTFRTLHPEEKQTRTYHGFRGGTSGKKIDHILASPGVKVLSAEILRDRIPGEGSDARYPSDHYPVAAEMSFPVE